MGFCRCHVRLVLTVQTLGRTSIGYGCTIDVVGPLDGRFLLFPNSSLARVVDEQTIVIAVIIRQQQRVHLYAVITLFEGSHQFIHLVVDGLRFLLIQFRVNERITDGNAQSSPNQFRQIDIQRMVRERGIVKLLSSRRLL